MGLRGAVGDAPDVYGELEQGGPLVLVIQTLTEDVTACSGEYGVPHSELGLFVLGVLDGEKVQLFIDSGASVSILSYQVCRRLGLSLAPPSEFEACRLVTADGSVYVVEGSVVVQTWVCPREVDLEFVVAFMTDQVILGMSALCDLGFNLSSIFKFRIYLNFQIDSYKHVYLVYFSRWLSALACAVRPDVDVMMNRGL